MPSVSLIFTALLGLSAAATGRAAYTAGYLVEYFRQCEPGNFVDVDDSGATDPQLSITIPQINYPASSQWVQPNGENLPFTDEFAARFTGELSILATDMSCSAIDMPCIAMALSCLVAVIMFC